MSRNRSEIDERNLIVSITEAGDALREQARDIPGEMTKWVNLTAEESRQLYKLLYHLLEQVKQ